MRTFLLRIIAPALLGALLVVAGLAVTSALQPRHVSAPAGIWTPAP